jgi:hypothetical protein
MQQRQLPTQQLARQHPNATAIRHQTNEKHLQTFFDTIAIEIAHRVEQMEYLQQQRQQQKKPQIQE